MLETLNLARNYAHLFSFRKKPFSTKAFLILMMSAFFWIKSGFFGQHSTFTQSNNVRAELEIF